MCVTTLSRSCTLLAGIPLFLIPSLHFHSPCHLCFWTCVSGEMVHCMDAVAVGSFIKIGGILPQTGGHICPLSLKVVWGVGHFLEPCHICRSGLVGHSALIALGRAGSRPDLVFLELWSGVSLRFTVWPDAGRQLFQSTRNMNYLKTLVWCTNALLLINAWMQCMGEHPLVIVPPRPNFVFFGFFSMAWSHSAVVSIIAINNFVLHPKNWFE